MEYFRIDDDEKYHLITKNADILALKINQIKVIYSIHLKKALTQREIERIADLRQPEVSVALNELRKNGFVEYHSDIPSPKGRPVIIYTLKKPISEIFMDIKKQKETEIRLIKLALDELTETMENI